MALSNGNLQDLINLGVSERESKLYLIMLEYGEVNASNLHRLSGVNRSKIYSILSKMVLRGLCSERIEGRNRYFTAIDPKTVKESLFQQWENEKQNKFELAETTFENLLQQYKNSGSGSPKNVVELIINPNNIRNRYLQLISNSTIEILAFNRPPFAAATKKAIEIQRQAQIDAMDRGVKIRSITGQEEVKDKGITYERIHENDFLRITNHLPIKLFVFDTAKVFIGLPTTTLNDIDNFMMMYVDDPGFAELCTIAFDAIWNKALPIERLAGNEVVWTKSSED